MIPVRFVLPALGALLLSACGALPPAQSPADAAATDSTPLNTTPRVASAPVVPQGPLQALTVEAPAQPQTPVAALEAPKDLWQRMRRGFAMPDLDNERVRDREQWYASRSDYIQRMTDRGSKYLFHIVEELERRNLPQELALLPFIESAFNPQAVSSAKAAGMWQFMPATGRDFDLKQNLFRDDRRDVLASTRAALDYLERLHGMFGDWHLALAAYNWGEGNVMRAIKRNRAEGLATGYDDLRMPAETRYYVPKLQAMKNIVAAPERFALTLPNIGNHPFFDSVTIERDMDVSVIVQLADVSERDFQQLNPSHNKPVVLAGGASTILLPWDNALRFSERLRRYDGPTASWTAWRVPKRMTAAAAAKEHGISEAELRRINRIPARMMLRAGSTVLVPRQGRLDRDAPEHLADNGQLLLAPEVVSSGGRRVTVRPGDTLSHLARRHGVTVAQLRSWNGLKPGGLKAGQTLIVAQGGRPERAASKVRASSVRKAQAATRAPSAKRNRKTTVASSKTAVTSR